jgi:heme oxygenase
MLHGRIERRAYALLLRNLLPIYQQMELGLERLRASPWISPIALPEVYRTKALESDLATIAGPNWRKDLAILPAAEQYAHRVAAASEAGGTLLPAHAYVRYLGDLNGGQVLKRLLSRSLGLDDASLSFYEFAEIADLDAFKLRFRAALDLVGCRSADLDAIVAEARMAFLQNIAVSKEVKTMSDRAAQAVSR